MLAEILPHKVANVFGEWQHVAVHAIQTSHAKNLATNGAKSLLALDVLLLNLASLLMLRASDLFSGVDESSPNNPCLILKKT